MSSDSSIPSINLSELHKEIECDQCQKKNPPKRCSRCHLTYYCSVPCQKAHRKIHKCDCKPVDEMKSRLVGVQAMSPTTTTDDDAAISKSCSICLSETIENPIVLPECGHTFCFPCLMEWQNYTKNAFTYRTEPTSSQQGHCPYCRKTIATSIVEDALDKALLYAAAGRLTDKVYDRSFKNDQSEPSASSDDTADRPIVTMDERQEKFCQLAVDQVNKVLASNPRHLAALCIKGQILRHVKPQDSINALNEALQIDAEGIEKQQTLLQIKRDIEALQTQMELGLTIHDIENEVHPMNEEGMRLTEAYEKLLTESENGWQIGDGPYRLYPTKIWLSEAYESAGEYENAQALYKEMIHVVFQLEFEDYIQVDPPTIRMMLSGGSRCLYHVKDFDRAKHFAQSALDMNRHFPGIHILIARSQWAMNEKQDAVRTMCRGVLYETPWDEANQQRNCTYLQEFMDALKSEGK